MEDQNVLEVTEVKESKEKKPRFGLEIIKIAIDIMAGYGTNCVLSNFFNEFVPSKAKLPAKICAAVGAAVMTDMIVDKEMEHIGKKVKVVKDLLDSIDEIKEKNETENTKESEDKGE